MLVVAKLCDNLHVQASADKQEVREVLSVPVSREQLEA